MVSWICPSSTSSSSPVWSSDGFHLCLPITCASLSGPAHCMLAALLLRHIFVCFLFFSRIIWLGSLTQKRKITSCRFRWLVLDWSPLSSSWIVPVSQNHMNAGPISTTIKVPSLFSRHQVNVMIISAPKYSNNWTKTSQSGCFDSSMIPPGFWVFMVIQMGWMLTVCLSVLSVCPICLSYLSILPVCLFLIHISSQGCWDVFTWAAVNMNTLKSWFYTLEILVWQKP